MTSTAATSLFRFATAGSVDDGKSTLVGRLLHDSKSILIDQLEAVTRTSLERGFGGDAGGIDLALFTDGLRAEREQGITIDVAYRHFSTEHRHFIVADAPGHEQYTRNMVTGASTADCAVILIDARLGVSRQTRRHSYLVALLGIEHVVVAVNKMDTVDYSSERVGEIQRAYADVMARIEFSGETTCIPVSALHGANVLERSADTPWYDGPTLMEYLEGVEVESSAIASPFRMPIQWVNRASSDFRGFAGTIVSGALAPGDEIVAAPSGRGSRIERIVGADGDLERAVAGQAVTVTLTDEIDCSRGDVIATPADPPTVSDQLQATIVWMHEEPMLRGRSYLLRIGDKTVTATVAPLESTAKNRAESPLSLCV